MLPQGMEAYPSRTDKSAVINFKTSWLQPFRDANGKLISSLVSTVYWRPDDELRVVAPTHDHHVTPGRLTTNSPDLRRGSGIPPRPWILKPGWFTARVKYTNLKTLLGPDEGDATAQGRANRLERRHMLYVGVRAYSYFKDDCEKIYDTANARVTWKRTDIPLVWAAKRFARHLTHYARLLANRAGPSSAVMLNDARWLRETFYGSTDANPPADPRGAGGGGGGGGGGNNGGGNSGGGNSGGGNSGGGNSGGFSGFSGLSGGLSGVSSGFIRQQLANLESPQSSFRLSSGPAASTTSSALQRWAAEMGLPPVGARQVAIQDLAQRTTAAIRRPVNNVPAPWQNAERAGPMIAAAILAAESPRTAAQVRGVQVNAAVVRNVQRALSQQYASPAAVRRAARRASSSATSGTRRGAGAAGSLGAIPRSRATRNLTQNTFQRALGNVLQNTGTTRSRRA